MAEAPSGWQLGLLILLSGAATYLWRGLGVAVSDKLRPDSEAFVWVACVAYAMIAGLIARVILIPVGLLAETLLWERALACAAAAAAFFLGGRNLFIGVGTGGIVLVALGYLHALG